MKLYVEHLHEVLFTALSKSEESIQIISPFLTDDTVDTLCGIITQNKVSCTLITRFSPDDMVKGSNSMDALEQLLEVGASVYDKGAQLHAKIYIIDNKLAFVGSANFTHSGLEKNYEIFVSIDKESEAEQFETLCRYIEPWTKECYKIQKTHIEKYRPEIKKKKQENAATAIKKQETQVFVHPKRSKQRKWLTKQNKVEHEPTVWIKYVGVSTRMSIRRQESKGIYKIPHSSTANIDYLAFPEKQPPAGIVKGDIIYIAFLGADKVSGERRTFIVGKAISKGLDRKQPKKQELAKDREKAHQEKWPIYLELEETSSFPGAIQDAMEITELWEKEGRQNSYIPRGSHLTILRPEAKALLEEYSKQFQ